MSNKINSLVGKQSDYQMRSYVEEAISSMQDSLYNDLESTESLPDCVILSLVVTTDAVLELIKPLARAVESAALGSIFVLAMAFATLNCIFFTGKWQPINRCARQSLIFFSDSIQKIIRFAGRALFLPLAIVGQILVIKQIEDEDIIYSIGRNFFRESHGVEAESLDGDSVTSLDTESSDESDVNSFLQSEVKECFEEMQDELYKELRPSLKDKSNSVGLASALPCAVADVCIEGVKRLTITTEMSGNILLLSAVSIFALAGLSSLSPNTKQNIGFQYAGLIAGIGTCWSEATDALGQFVSTVALSPLTIPMQTVQILLNPKKVKPCRLEVFSLRRLGEPFRIPNETALL